VTGRDGEGHRPNGWFSVILLEDDARVFPYASRRSRGGKGSLADH